MDEKGFRRFLNDKKSESTTIVSYVKAVKKFKKLLRKQWNKSLEEANESDLRACKVLTKNSAYAYGVRAYYEYLDKQEIVETINSEIIPKLHKKRSKDVLRWTEFRNIMKQAEKRDISTRDRALLNILWSCMKSGVILQLRRSGIDFEKRVITNHVDLKTYGVTPEAWAALKKFILIESGDTRKLLFPNIKARAVETITKKY